MVEVVVGVMKVVVVVDVVVMLMVVQDYRWGQKVPADRNLRGYGEYRHWS